ncbi:L-asparaginase [Cladophialophora yegresii CBS 114405]|uniref:asparaginase n=1 Tax=Cladophialophora yegresii CBS 114405 TaxID=1182544 RepID=W9VZ07_9EURO|nr:L-asparaginase [Cladophialophora yegresii CBS 114405]EXJ60888.1 L-asparaginase [Cladophialophora yegresii CBS 114405]
MSNISTTGHIPEARVLIIMTGGTICMQKSPNGLVPARNFLERCMAPRPEFNDGEIHDPMEVRLHDGPDGLGELQSLRTPTSVYGKRVRQFEELLDSSSIDSQGWAEIAQTIFRNYKLFDGFVVLHGTDSLAYTCSALSFMLQNLGKPVILTGSQVPFSERKNDAMENLLDSLDIAGHFMIPEVCLCFNSTLFRGNRTTKVSASAFDAFASPNFPPLAKISAIDTNVEWSLVTRSTSLEPFSVQANLQIHYVACLRIFPGIKPSMVDSVLRTEGLQGLVLETFGAGNAPSGHDNKLTQVITEAVQRGIVIVNITQCLTGSVNPLYAPGMVLGRAGVVAGGDMTSEAALTKLSYLLGLPGATPDSVAKGMAISIRGELSEHAGTIFRHPTGELSSPVAQLTAIAYAIASGDVEKVKDLLRNDSQLMNRADYSGNTPVHLAATGPSLAVLRHLLSLGASVHIRNHTGSGRTPLFLAANAGLLPHVLLLRQAGGHLHAEELETARLHASQRPDVWKAAGLEAL